MAIKGLIRAARSPRRARPAGLAVATGALLAGALLGGCGGGSAPVATARLAARVRRGFPATPIIPVMAMANLFSGSTRW